jgi:hypothetical protein
MPRTVAVIILFVAMLAGIGTANNSSMIAGPNNGPIVRWEKFYDRDGNPLPGDPHDGVSDDSLFFKQYDVLDTLYGCPKSGVPNPAPASCRTGFAFHYGQTRVGMDPAGIYIYEVDETTLRRHSTNDGSYTDHTITNGSSACRTDGNYLYVPVDDMVYKYTLDGVLVSQTTLDIVPNEYNFSLANDTVWCGIDSVLNGYACSKFAGGSITPDATWDVGSGSVDPAFVAWDGQYYYVAWSGTDSNTFKRFNPDRTLSASGTISLDPRGVMCVVPGARQVVLDSLYWKLYTSTTDLYSSAKAQDVTAAQPTPFSWQITQSVPCMTPDGQYVLEVSGTNMRRTDLSTGAVANYTLADASGGACGTDGEYVYVPNDTITRKYTLEGVLVSTTTTDYAPSVGTSTFGFGVANDTVWISPELPGDTWYGYACSEFNGGSVTHDATWVTGGVQESAMTVVFDGQYYYMNWGGMGTNTFMRFNGDRTLYSSGTVTGDSRSVMCMWDQGTAVSEPGSVLPSTALLRVIPNPVRSGVVNLRYNLPKPGPVTVTVYDISGRPVERTSTAAGRTGAVQLDLGELSDGVYLVRLNAGAATVLQKLVVQR